MYINISVAYCRPYPNTETGYLFSYKSFFCKNFSALVKAWRWICRKQNKSDFFISFCSYFCSENGISAISSYSMSREIANPDDLEFCKEIYDTASVYACYEHLSDSFKSQFDDFSLFLW